MTARRTRKTITAKAAKSLAVSYNAYIEARHASDHNGVRVWARCLKEAQAETGVEFYSAASLDLSIELSYDLERLQQAA